MNKDYVGINIHVYDPIMTDPGAHGACTNIIGVDPTTNISYTNGVISNIQSSASVLTVLNAHRNGHWGYSSWKQIRAHENPLSRFYKTINLYTFLAEPQTSVINESITQTTLTTITFDDWRHPETVSRTNTHSRPSTVTIKDVIECVDEPPLVDKHMPIRIKIGKTFFIDDLPNKRNFDVAFTYNNKINFFTNFRTNKHANAPTVKSDEYELMKSLYLSGALTSEKSPFNSFSLTRFTQTVFPPEIYTFKSFMRERINFISGYWRDDRSLRSEKQHDGFALIVW